MDFFDRHKALIITSLLYGILLLVMYNINVSREGEKIRETLIELREYDVEHLSEPQKPELEEKRPEQPRERSRELQTHQAFNEQLEPQEQIQSRLNEIFEKNAAESRASEEIEGSGTFPAASKEKNRKLNSQGNNSTKEVSARQGSLESSSISFSLKGRQAIDIPNPVYTCDRPGKIVVNITVNAQGAVTSTSINRASSTSTNECLTERAMEYASGALFTPLPGRTAQPGTITYEFQD